MFELFKDHSEKKRKEAHELKIKKALSDKFFNYDESDCSITENISENTDYTLITIRGKRIRTKMEHITILDVPSYMHS